MEANETQGQESKSFFKKRRNLVVLAGAAFVLLLACCVATQLFNGDEAVPEEIIDAGTEIAEQPLQPTDTPPPEPTDIPEPTDTPLPEPTDTPEPEPTPEPEERVATGTHLVDADITPGIYVGFGGETMLGSCYWARLSDLSGEFAGVIANDSARGQFYVEVLQADRALETRCELLPIEAAPAPEEPLTEIGPGVYIVERDIAPGTYVGIAGESIGESCYWARLSCVRGTFDCIISNDNAVGQFFVQIAPSDFALEVGCEVERVE